MVFGYIFSLFFEIKITLEYQDFFIYRAKLSNIQTRIVCILQITVSFNACLVKLKPISYRMIFTESLTHDNQNPIIWAQFVTRQYFCFISSVDWSCRVQRSFSNSPCKNLSVEIINEMNLLYHRSLRWSLSFTEYTNMLEYSKLIYIFSMSTLFYIYSFIGVSVKNSTYIEYSHFDHNGICTNRDWI